MSIYQAFCREKLDPGGSLAEFSLSYPDDFNFGYDVVDRAAQETPEKRALVWCSAEGEERVFSFREIRAMSNQAANVFLSAGIKRGDRVVVILKRHYEYWAVVVALHKIGAVLVPVTNMVTEQDLQVRLHLSKASAAVVTPDDSVPEKALKAIKEEGMTCLLWTVRREVPGFMNLSKQMETESENLGRRETKAKDPMLLYFTSGTTGFPKGVIHDFTYPLAHIITAKYWQGAEEGGLHFTVADTGWGKASWGKIYGQWLVGCAVIAYDFDTFDPSALAGIINRYGVTSFCAPPTVYRYLVRRGIPPLPSLKHATTAGEALSPDVFEKFTDQTGLKLYEGYGQTETVLLLANFAGCEPADASLGFPSPLFRIELRDRDGSRTKQGEIGEIVVIPGDGTGGEGLFAGYLGNEIEERFSWRGDVYHTGDAAWQDGEGRFWFHSRFDDIIKTGGYRVGPYEIEKVLMEDEAVEECSVIGVPDVLRGQAIKACVVLSEGLSPSIQLANSIRSRCNRKLAEYKWIRIVEFVKSLPKTISGKIRPIELRKAAARNSAVVMEGERPAREMT